MTDRETQLAVERKAYEEYKQDQEYERSFGRELPRFTAEAMAECAARIKRLEAEIANEAKQGRLW